MDIAPKKKSSKNALFIAIVWISMISYEKELDIDNKLHNYSKTCLKRTPYIQETWTKGK